MRRLAVPVRRPFGAFRAIGVVLIITPTVLAGCGNPDVEPAAQPVVTSAPAVPASLSFSAPKVGGGVIDMRDYAGKPVALWFWAPT